MHRKLLLWLVRPRNRMKVCVLLTQLSQASLRRERQSKPDSESKKIVGGEKQISSKFTRRYDGSKERSVRGFKFGALCNFYFFYFLSFPYLVFFFCFILFCIASKDLFCKCLRYYVDIKKDTLTIPIETWVPRDTVVAVLFSLWRQNTRHKVFTLSPTM